MIQGPTTGIIEQKLTSMQINKKPIKEARKGLNIAFKTKEKVRKNDKIYIINDA